MFDHADAAFGDCAGEDRVDLVSGEYERLFRHLLRRHRLGRLAADEGGPFDDILGALHEVGETLLFFQGLLLPLLFSGLFKERLRLRDRDVVSHGQHEYGLDRR